MTGVTIDPNIQGGAPCIAGTRIPVATIKRCRKGGWGFERILKEFPSLNCEQIEAALEYELTKPAPRMDSREARERWVVAQSPRVHLLAPRHTVEVSDLLRAAWDDGNLLSVRRA